MLETGSTLRLRLFFFARFKKFALPEFANLAVLNCFTEILPCLDSKNDSIISSRSADE